MSSAASAPARHAIAPSSRERGRPFVEVRNLRRVFDVSKPWLNRVLEGGERQFLTAVADVSFNIASGDTFALVGESGGLIDISLVVGHPTGSA